MLRIIGAIVLLVGLSLLGLALAPQHKSGGQIITAVNISGERPGFLFIDTDNHLTVDVPLPVNGVRTTYLSPDGHMALAYATNHDLQTQVVYVFDLIEQRVIHSVDLQSGTDIFTTYPPVLFGFTWSPDSRYLAFRNPASDGLYIIDVEARYTRHVMEGIHIESLQWTPDSRYLALRLAQRAALSIYDLQTGAQQSLTIPAWLGALTWAEDSDHYTFQSDRGVIVGSRRAGGTLYTLPEAAYVVWSLDSAWLAYTTQPGRIFTLHIASGETYRLDLQGVEEISWSPQSDLLALAVPYLSDYARSQIFLAAPDGSALSLFTDDGQNPQWSADGRYIAYQSLNRNRLHPAAHLYVGFVQADGGNIGEGTPWLVADNVIDPRWLADRPELAFTRQDRVHKRLYITTLDGDLRLGVGDDIKQFVYWDD